MKLNQGMKHDNDKLLWDLVTWQEMNDVVKVMMMGAKKYSPDNWQKISHERYVNALLRHAIDYQGGETFDSESGQSHLAHVVCNALFAMWHAKRINKGLQKADELRHHMLSVEIDVDWAKMEEDKVGDW